MTEATTRPLRVLMLAAECKPYAWTGGLGDVVGSLPTALRNLGADVRVALPHYGAIDSTAHNVTTNGAAFTVPMDGVARHGSIGLVEQSSFPLYLIGSEDYFANRPNLYGYPDDGHRFVFFSRGALEVARTLGGSQMSSTATGIRARSQLDPHSPRGRSAGGRAGYRAHDP